MISTLLNLLTRSANYPSQLQPFNTWFFLNAHIFYFKLSNQLTFFTYVNESLKINHIRVYNKQFSILTCLSVCFKGCLVAVSVFLF